MVKTTKGPQSPQPAELSTTQIKAAIPKLERRLAELREVDVRALASASSLDAKMENLHNKYDTTLIDEYGNTSIEYNKFSLGSFAMYAFSFGHETSIHEQIEGYEGAVNRAISNIETALELMHEQLEDVGELPGARAIQPFGGLDLHQEISRRVSRLYKDGHYANAVEAAVKALNGLVRYRSDIEGIDGSALMEKVFSLKDPMLRFNELKNQSDREEQRGFMMLFSGAVAGLRNLRAHGFIDDDPERTLEFIAFISLLAKLLDGAKHRDEA